MKCTNCGFDNQEDALFCEACGSPLIKPVSYDNDPLHKGVDNSGYNNGQNNGQYNGQNNSGYNDQYNGQYGGGYNDQYNGQYGNGYNGRYQDQYNDQYGYNDGYMDDRQWEEERQRRIEQRKARRIYEQKKENRKIIIIGIVIAAAIAVIGVAAFFGVNYFMGNSQTSQNQPESTIENPIKNKDNNTTPTPEVTKEPELTPSATPTPTPTPTQTPKPTPTVTPTPEPELTAQVKTASSVDKSGYSKVVISSSSASSTIKQENYDNSSNMTYDGDVITSWQEGAEGYGIGEFLHYEFAREYDIKCITFNMGNWRTEELFYQNCRPKDITVWVGDKSFDITVPDGMTEYCMELSREVPASEVFIQINSVYTEGTDCEDTCISEVGIYGK